MAKKNTTGIVTSKVAMLTAEEFQKLSPEEQFEYMQKLQSENSALSAEVKEQAAKMPKELPSFEVENDVDNDIQGGEYQFTCPTFHWDDGSVIDVRELSAAAEGKDAKLAEKAQGIISALVQRKSGIIILRKEA